MTAAKFLAIPLLFFMVIQSARALEGIPPLITTPYTDTAPFYTYQYDAAKADQNRYNWEVNQQQILRQMYGEKINRYLLTPTPAMGSYTMAPMYSK